MTKKPKPPPDMDKVKLRASEASIVLDGSDWLSPAERKKKLSAARRNAIALSIGGVVIFTWSSTVRETLFIAACVVAAIPWVAIALAAGARDLYSLWFKRNDARGPLGFAIALPGVGLSLRILDEFNVLDWKNIHPFALALTVLMALAVGSLDTTVRNFKIIFVLLAALIYSYSSLKLLDIVADKSAGQAYRAEVLDKRHTPGSPKSYSLVLAPWGPVTHKETHDVLLPLYNSLSKGDMTCIQLHDGFLGLPWYKIGTCTEEQ